MLNPGDLQTGDLIGNSISVERSLPPRVRRPGHVEGCSCLLNHRCCAHEVWSLSPPSFMFWCVSRQRYNEKVSTPCGDPLKDFDDLTRARTERVVHQLSDTQN